MTAEELLTPELREVLNRARAARLNYAVRVLAYPGDDTGLLVVLGEAHVKFAKAAALGKEIVGHFQLRGVETFQSHKVAGGRVLGALIQFPRAILGLVSLGHVRGSTIKDAKDLPGTTVELEAGQPIPLALHVGSLYLTGFFIAVASYWIFLPASALHLLPGLIEPLVSGQAWAAMLLQLHLLALVPAWILRRQPWSWLIHPMLAIVTVRDALMAEGTVRMLDANPEHRIALAIMGRAHLPGFERELIEKHGFRRVEF